MFAVIPFFSQYKIRSLCKKNNAFFIPDSTEWYSAKGKGYIFGLIKWIDTSLRMRYIHCKSDGIIATSDYLANYYKRKNIKVLELPSMFDSEDFKKIQSI